MRTGACDVPSFTRVGSTSWLTSGVAADFVGGRNISPPAVLACHLGGHALIGVECRRVPRWRTREHTPQLPVMRTHGWSHQGRKWCLPTVRGKHISSSFLRYARRFLLARIHDAQRRHG